MTRMEANVKMDTYVVELKPVAVDAGNRTAAVMARRQHGEHFIASVETMLRHYRVEREAPVITVTMLGHITLKCSRRVAQLLISAADLPIETIRQSRQFTEVALA